MGLSWGEETGLEEKLLGLSLWLKVKGFLVSLETLRLRLLRDGLEVKV